MAGLEKAANAAASKLGYPALKPEQLQVVVEFLSGKDVFAVLPTGFGKSLCYAVLPLAFDQLRSQEEKSIVVVILFGLEGRSNLFTVAAISSSERCTSDRQRNRFCTDGLQMFP